MRFMKKTLTFIVLGLGYVTFVNNSYAATSTAVPASFDPYLYVGGEVGWANSNWSNFTNINADNDGAAYGGKIGYQASRRLGAEFGGFILPKSNQNGTVDNVSVNGAVTSWAGYGVVTFRFPLLTESFYLRSKAGLAYRNLVHEGNLYAGVGDGNYWTAILGASLNYNFNTQVPFILGVEYSNIFGSSESWSSHGNINENAAPAVQIVAATLSVILKI